MADKKDKVVSFRRAEWVVDQPATLESLVKQAQAKLKSAADRTINHGGQEMLLAYLMPAKVGGYLLHITVDTPGESASTVPKERKTTDEIEVGTAAPPTDAEFMDGDAFLYVIGDDVCLCTTGLHDTAIRFFLQAFFRAANLRHDSDQFELMKVADVSGLKLLQKQGVREIELLGTVSDATAHYVRRKGQTFSLLGLVGRQLKALIEKENDVTEDAMRVHLTLTTDRRRKGLALGEKRIQALASDVVKNQEAGDEFAIITKTGQKIGPKEIFVRATKKIEGKGKSVSRNDAWQALLDFYASLKSSGILAE